MMMTITTITTTKKNKWKGQRATKSSGIKNMKGKDRSRRRGGINSAGKILQNTFN
jgi:hypothetical protein